MIKRSLKSFTSAVAIVLLISGCSMTDTTESIPEGMTAIEHRSFDQLLLKPDTDFSRYTKVKFEPVNVEYSDRRRFDPVYRDDEDFQFDDKELAQFNKQWVKALTKQWGKSLGWEPTESSGNDVIVVKANITNLYLNAPIKNDEPFSVTHAVHESGHMTINLTLEDSANGDVLLQSSGRKVTGSRHTGPNSLTRMNAVRYWQDAYIAFQQWGSLVAEEIDSK